MDNKTTTGAKMEWRLIDVLILIVIGLNVWNIKTTHELTIDVAVLKSNLVQVERVQSNRSKIYEQWKNEKRQN